MNTHMPESSCPFQRYKMVQLERKGICKKDFFRESCAVDSLIPKGGRCPPSPQVGLPREMWELGQCCLWMEGTADWCLSAHPRTSGSRVTEALVHHTACYWHKGDVSVF